MTANYRQRGFFTASTHRWILPSGGFIQSVFASIGRCAQFGRRIRAGLFFRFGYEQQYADSDHFDVFYNPAGRLYPIEGAFDF